MGRGHDPEGQPGRGACAWLAVPLTCPHPGVLFCLLRPQGEGSGAVGPAAGASGDPEQSLRGPADSSPDPVFPAAWVDVRRTCWQDHWSPAEGQEGAASGPVSRWEAQQPRPGHRPQGPPLSSQARGHPGSWAASVLPSSGTPAAQSPCHCPPCEPRCSPQAPQVPTTAVLAVTQLLVGASPRFPGALDQRRTRALPVGPLVPSVSPPQTWC